MNLSNFFCDLAFIDLAFDAPPNAVPENAGRTEICVTATLRPVDPGLISQFTTAQIAQIVAQTEPVFAVEVSASSTFFPMTGNLVV